MLFHEVSVLFEDAVSKRLTEKEKDLIPFITNHERKTIVIQNLCNQIILYETRFGPEINIEHRNMIVGEVAKMFIAGAKLAKEHEIMSSVRKASMQRKKSDAEETIAIAESMVEEVHDRE